MTTNRYDDYEDDEQEFATPTTSTTKPAVTAKPDTGFEPASTEVATARTIKRGWGAADRVQEAASPYAQRFKVLEETQVIKFLEDEPYASFRTHWIDGRQGQKSFVCLHDDPNGCPLCDAGNRPSTKFAFNIALLANGEDPVVKSFEVGVRLIDQLKNFHLDPRQGPLSKHYWAVSKTGKGAQTQTILQMVRERDLEEWKLTPITEDGMKVLVNNAYDPSIIQIPTRSDLLEVATELLDAR
jgi:hypothetical protein